MWGVCAACTFVHLTAAEECAVCGSSRALCAHFSCRLSSVPCAVTPLHQRINWEHLPRETTTALFRICCSTSAGVFPVWARLTRTCRSWRQLTLTQPELFHTVDLSSGWCSPDQAKLSKLRFPTAVRRLNLSSCTKIIDCSVLARFSSIEQLDISFLTKLHAAPMSEVLRGASKLSELTVDGCAFKGSHNGAKGVNAVLDAVRAYRHPTLQKLSIAGCLDLQNAGLLRLFGLSQPPLLLLQELDMSAAGVLHVSIKLPIESLVQCCPNLAVLLVSGLGGAYGWTPNPVKLSALQLTQSHGLRKLRVCHAAAVDIASNESITHSLSMLDDSLCGRLMATSSGLTDLDLSGTRISCGCLDGFSTCVALKTFSFARTALASDEGIALICNIWSASLTSINASQGKARLTDESCSMLAMCGSLEVLNLTDTNVTDEGTKCLLRNVPCLKVLVLGGCRGLSRNVRIASTSAGSGLRQLKKALHL